MYLTCLPVFRYSDPNILSDNLSLENTTSTILSYFITSRQTFSPFSNMKLVPCLLCGKKWVPECILATCEPPARLPVRGSGVFVQARVCRARPKATGETDALAVSEALPFLEFELARQMMLKLKCLGRNCAFGLKSEIDLSLIHI